MTLPSAHVGPQGSSFESGQFGEKSDAYFTIKESEEAELLELIRGHDGILMDRHPELDSPIKIESEMLMDGKSNTLKVKVKGKTTGNLFKTDDDLKTKSDTLCAVASDKLVTPTLFVSGYYYNSKTSTVKLCLSLVKIDSYASPSTRKPAAATARTIPVKRSRQSRCADSVFKVPEAKVARTTSSIATH